jgi:hypothetical protein
LKFSANLVVPGKRTQRLLMLTKVASGRDSGFRNRMNFRQHYGPRSDGFHGGSWDTTLPKPAPQRSPRIRLALLTARRTAPHCLSAPLLSERIIRASVGICPFAWRCLAMRQTSSFSNCSRSRVLSFWHLRYRDRIGRQRSGHFSAKFETDKPS